MGFKIVDDKTWKYAVNDKGETLVRFKVPSTEFQRHQPSLRRHSGRELFKKKRSNRNPSYIEQENAKTPRIAMQKIG